MTAQEELTVLETAYAAWIAAGCPTSVAINGRMVSRDANFFTKRIDLLRTQVTRETSGMFFAAQNRQPE